MVSALPFVSRLHLPDVVAAGRFDGDGTRALPGQPGQIVPARMEHLGLTWGVP